MLNVEWLMVGGGEEAVDGGLALSAALPVPWRMPEFRRVWRLRNNAALFRAAAAEIVDDERRADADVVVGGEGDADGEGVDFARLLV